jgi:hypothetical protein
MDTRILLGFLICVMGALSFLATSVKINLYIGTGHTIEPGLVGCFHV